jgi:hypothetical protein
MGVTCLEGNTKKKSMKIFKLNMTFNPETPLLEIYTPGNVGTQMQRHTCKSFYEAWQRKVQ